MPVLENYRKIKVGMERDEIDFGTLKVSVLFRKLFIPTLFGMLSISARWPTGFSSATASAVTASPP